MPYSLTDRSLSGIPLLPAHPAPQKFLPKLDPRFVQKELRRERRRLERIALSSTSERQVRNRLAKYEFDPVSANITPMRDGFRIHAWSALCPTVSICVP